MPPWNFTGKGVCWSSVLWLCFVGADGWGSAVFQHSVRAPLRLESRLSVTDGETGVVFGVVLFVGAEISDAPNDLFGVVASCKGPLRVGPIPFGLGERLSGTS